MTRKIWFLLLICSISCGLALSFAAAGTFYPADPKELNTMITEYLALAQPSVNLPKAPKALIVPHAGYIYSGQTAAYAYKAIEGRPYDTVIIIGPSHYTNNDQLAVYDGNDYQTPLGKIKIDKTIVKQLFKFNKKFTANPKLFEKEHSLEVQLPFLQKSLKKFSVVLISMEEQSYENAMLLKDALEDVLKKNDKKKILLIASTDLSHYYPYADAQKKDQLAVDLILQGSVPAFGQSLNDRQCELCGFGGVLTLMALADDLGWGERELLKLNNSGDSSGDLSRVVGYASIAYLEGRRNSMLNEAEQKFLLDLARTTIKNKLEGKKLPEAVSDKPALKQIAGVFVTLKIHDQLRGCIGHIIGIDPLVEGVSEMAQAAAFGDPRFLPLTKEEYPGVEIEISVLTPPKKISGIDEIKIGRDGIIIKKGFNQGVFLPQVPVEQGWNLDQYLEGICRKAGLPNGSWKDAELFTFEAQVFQEK
ncbi:MAG: AmmeMemoRadiSam system protein B [Candidatus Margulisiibacteriota bacterium]|jgi:hypothetical protein